MAKKFYILMAAVAILGLSCSLGLQGGNGIDVVGNSTDNSVTLSLDGTVVRGVLTDSGNATGSGNWLSMLGSGNVTISASGSTITISCIGGEGGGGNATYALDSDKLDGQHGSYYLSTTGTAADSTLFYGFTAIQWTSAMDAIAAAATSADSDKLDGQHGSYYLTTTGTAADSTLFYGFTALQWTSVMDAIAAAATSADSDKLDGLHGISYLLGNATAADSDKLDGQHGSYYLSTTGTAADSDKLDGQHGSGYAVAGSGVIGVVAGAGISVSANTGNVTITNTSVDTQLLTKVKEYTRTATTGAGDVSYTGIGFKPTTLEAYVIVDGTSYACWGFADSGKAGASTYTYWGSTAQVFHSYAYFVDIGMSSAWSRADVKSYDDDGFTLTWTKTGSPSGTINIEIKASR
jgi:hypothetical protein